LAGIKVIAMGSKLVAAVLAVLNVLLWEGRAIAETHLLVPPVNPACISSPFGPRVLPDHPLAGTYHYGIDFPAPAGASVLATAPGKVIRVQKKGPGGLEILVQHDGFVGIYSHFGMLSPAFAEGKTDVAAGEKLGVVGRTGIISGTHVYFEMILAGKPVDPAPYLGVPLCGGTTNRRVAARKDSDGIEGAMIGGRKYYVLLPPARQ
jgi:murein DD-endopeptidase MepM/ murein hydrolase activator NlpD